MNPATLARIRDLTSLAAEAFKALGCLGWASIPYAITAAILMVGYGAGQMLAAVAANQVAR